MSQLGWHRRRKSLGSSGSENIRSESNAIDSDKAGFFSGWAASTVTTSGGKTIGRWDSVQLPNVSQRCERRILGADPSHMPVEIEQIGAATMALGRNPPGGV